MYGFICIQFFCAAFRSVDGDPKHCVIFQTATGLRLRRALQPVPLPPRPGAPLQERVLGPTQRPAECKPSLPGAGPLPEPEPASQMS